MSHLDLDPFVPFSLRLWGCWPLIGQLGWAGFQLPSLFFHLLRAAKIGPRESDENYRTPEKNGVNTMDSGRFSDKPIGWNTLVFHFHKTWFRFWSSIKPQSSKTQSCMRILLLAMPEVQMLYISRQHIVRRIEHGLTKGRNEATYLHSRWVEGSGTELHSKGM